jgi:ABC-type transport system involved in multi-copper enzyme maturation permease subunit
LLGPIFVREWLTVPRRSRHYVVRAAYLGLLWVIGLTAWQVTVGWSQTATLGDTARFGLLLFQIFTLVQLVLILFFSSLTAASAISQEKDRRTFVLLLMTDLRSYEIVVGKLLGSLLQMGLLLLGMLPVLAFIMLLGGVAAEQVAQAGLVLAATALAAGSLGTLVALWREKTFQALALTVLLLVLYLCLVEGLAAVPAVLAVLPGLHGYGSGWAVNQWQQWLNPFQALDTVLGPQHDRAVGVAPAYGFAGVMLLWSVVLNTWGILRLRVWNPSGEPIVQRERPEEEEEKDRLKAHAAPGKVRHVWANPILWREMRTRAYGRMPLLIKAAYFLVLALVCYYALAPLWTSGGRIEFVAARGLVPVGILSLLLISAQAVTAITSERDGGALDLLLVTDLTPKEFIFGKLGGILYNTKEYLLPPLLLACVYAYFGLLASPPGSHPEMLGFKNGEALVCVMGATLMLLAFAHVLGLHVALRNENSRLAISNTLGTVFFLSAGTLVCIFLIWINTHFELQWLSFMLFIAACIGGLWWVLSGDRPSTALTIASWACPLAVFYTVLNILVAKRVPGMLGAEESTDPLMPFLFTIFAFGFTLAAMLVPLLSEFDVALGRTSGGGE